MSISPQVSGSHSHSTPTPSGALRQAWVWYLILGFIPFAASLGVMSALTLHDGPKAPLRVLSGWFIGAILLLLIIGPIAFTIRSRMFRSYWRGEAVNPRTYLHGMLVVWFAFELGGLFSLVGCLMSNSIVPCLLPAIAAFMFFASLYPNGRAMARPTGNTDDPEIYQEPR
ncbi:MAG TPA: hypothetical protein VG326_04200 [Tepidisphaeraceae bacterium]|jgi:hypothetical protein|nr:hypothetical protein [Tepidisphaeraceae bacterium]